MSKIIKFIGDIGDKVLLTLLRIDLTGNGCGTELKCCYHLGNKLCLMEIVIRL